MIKLDLLLLWRKLKSNNFTLLKGSFKLPFLLLLFEEVKKYLVHFKYLRYYSNDKNAFNNINRMVFTKLFLMICSELC